MRSPASANKAAGTSYTFELLTAFRVSSCTACGDPQPESPNLQLGWQNSQNLAVDVADAVKRLKNEEARICSPRDLLNYCMLYSNGPEVCSPEQQHTGR